MNVGVDSVGCHSDRSSACALRSCRVYSRSDCNLRRLSNSVRLVTLSTLLSYLPENYLAHQRLRGAALTFSFAGI